MMLSFSREVTSRNQTLGVKNERKEVSVLYIEESLSRTVIPIRDYSVSPYCEQRFLAPSGRGEVSYTYERAVGRSVLVLGL